MTEDDRGPADVGLTQTLEEIERARQRSDARQERRALRDLASLLWGWRMANRLGLDAARELVVQWLEASVSARHRRLVK